MELHIGSVAPKSVQEQISDGTSWESFAECKGYGDLFSPPDHSEFKPNKDAREDRAREVCRACVVRSECLTDALDNRQLLDSTLRAGYNALELRRLILRMRR